MSEPDTSQSSFLHRPNSNDPNAWRTFWHKQDQPWRTEPEIDTQRQRYLYKCLHAIKTDMYLQGHPFKNIALRRADVEWLLTMNINGYGSIDLNGADLSKVDLHSLPLKEADLSEAHIERANLVGTHLERADLFRAYMEGTFLCGAYLERADLREADMGKVDLRDAHLEGSDFNRAHLEGANLSGAHLERAILTQANLEGANLSGAHLEGANLCGAFLTDATNLRAIFFGNEQTGFTSLAGVHWGDADLTAIDWAQLNILGDEQQSKQRFTSKGEIKDSTARNDEYRTAVSANRQLAVALQRQGLNEEAARFAYRAQLMQRRVFWYQRKFVQYLGSLFLDLLTGYGYRVERSFLAYSLVIGIFATIYHQLGAHLAWNEAIVISMTAFHGRGFFPDQFHPGDPQALVAAIEAFVGLLIEVTFIATLTQRLFGK